MAQYEIKINGVQQAISEVDALVEKLNALEAKIDTLSSKKIEIEINDVNANVTVDTNGTSNTESLREQDALLKQIEQTEEKITQVRRDEYQELLHQKDILKDVKKEEASRFAEDNLALKDYSNTMAGLKSRLADLKKAMQFREIGSDGFNKLVNEANEINQKLKDIESSYGQFGRNVGNHSNSINDAFHNIVIEVGGVERAFGSAREAFKSLKNERDTLALNGDRTSEEFKELDKIVKTLQSDINDLSKSSAQMDNLLDTLEGITAIGNASKSFSALFGFDDNKIEKSIQTLVALQSVLKSIEVIKKQMQTSEGIGSILTKGNDKIDKWLYSLQRTNVALRGTGTSARIAAVGIKALGAAIKGLATMGLAVAFEAALEALTSLKDAVVDWVKGDADLIKESDVLTASIDRQNEELKKNLDIIDKRAKANDLSVMDERIAKENAYAEALMKSRDALMKRNEAYEDQDIKTVENLDLSIANGDKGVTTVGGFDKAIENINDFIERYDYLEERVSQGKDLWDSFWGGFFSTSDDAKDELVHITKLVGSDFVSAMKKFSDGTAEGSRRLAEYISRMDKLTSGRYSKAIKLGIDEGYFDAQIKQAWDLYERFKQDVALDPIEIRLNFEGMAQQLIDGADKFKTAYYQRQRDALKDAYNQLGKDATAEDKKMLDRALAAIDKQEKETKKSVLGAAKRESDALKKQVDAADKELIRLRIANMKEGLNKTLTQLEEERRQKIQKIRDDGRNVRELELETNKLYDKKIEDAKEEHAKKVKEIYERLWNDIYAMNLQTNRKIVDIGKRQLEEHSKQLEDAKAQLMNQNISSYGIQGKEQLSTTTRQTLNIVSTEDTEVVNDYKKLIDIQRELSTAQNARATAIITTNNKIEEAEKHLVEVEEEATQKLQALDSEKDNMTNDDYEKKRYEIEKQVDVEKVYVTKLKESSQNELKLVEDTYNSKLALYNNYSTELEKKYDTDEKRLVADYTFNALVEENYTKDMQTMFKQRMTAVEAYWATRIQNEKMSIEALYEMRNELSNQEWKTESGETLARQEKLIEEADEAKKKGLMDETEYKKTTERISAETKNRLLTLEKDYSLKVIELERKKNDDLKKVNGEYFRDTLQEFRDFQTAVSELESKQPVMTKIGFLDIKATDKNNKQLLDSYEEMARQIVQKKDDITIKYQDGLIDENIYKSTLRELDNFSSQLGEKMDNVKNDMSFSHKFEQLSQEINQYVQQAAQAFQSLMQSVWDFQDAEYEAMMDELDKQIDALQEKYDKLEEIARNHKDNIDAIEDELSTARGDRRQMLIDALNSEIEAQRNAAAEQKKAEKEKQALEKKREKEEEEQKKKQHERDTMQAFINWHLMISNALTTQPFLPMAIIAAAMATTLGGIQYALVKSAKYKDGGVIQGKSHSQGGVKVMGGQVEVEGNEFITNKITTQKNVDVLEYINSKKRKLNLEDFIDFYGTNKKSITSKALPKTKFASGGQIPTLRTDIDVNDKVINALDAYANRPYYVAVREIETVQDDLKQVRVISGYE